MLRIGIIAMCCFAFGAQSALTTMNICDVLTSDFTKLNGRPVKVRGLLQATDEGIWLIGECKTNLVLKGLLWPNGFSVYVNMADDQAAGSWNKMNRKVKLLRARLGQDRIAVTITGKLETRESLEGLVVELPGGPRRTGFGHLGAAPAEINLISVEDVIVETRRRGTKTRIGSSKGPQ